MRVRDLIKDTAWLPGSGYANPPPRLSVLMPTFRGARQRLLLRAANSILTQPLRELELIIIDDGANDGTSEQIDALMAADSRVSCLRHPKNIGIPAISEYEGFIRARAAFIAFAFEDFIFADDSLGPLLAAAEHDPTSAMHGYVEYIDRDGRLNYYGKSGFHYRHLRSHNFLANASFIVPRAILEDVGLYDPHIAATRLCDWDLWRRILLKYSIRHVPVLIGREYGVTLDDSLGNSYPLLEEAVQEYFAQDRNDELRPECFSDVDVWSIPSNSSTILTAYILTMRKFFESKDWTQGLEIASGQEKGLLLAPQKRIIGICGDVEVGFALQLPDAVSDGLSMHYIPPVVGKTGLAYTLAGCSAVVNAGGQPDWQTDDLTRMCGILGIPTVAALDQDRLASVLSASKPVDILEWVRRLRLMLQAFEEDRRKTDEARVTSDSHLRAELLAVDRDRAKAIAELKAQQSSRTYRFALQLRRLSVALRRIFAVFGGLRSKR
jgi:hypothetical protein